MILNLLLITLSRIVLTKTRGHYRTRSSRASGISYEKTFVSSGRTGHVLEESEYITLPNDFIIIA